MGARLVRVQEKTKTNINSKNYYLLYIYIQLQNKFIKVRKLK